MEKGIYKAITSAMADITPIAKSKKNAQQGFQYRGIDDVMNELSPILTKHKIFIYPEVINVDRSERVVEKTEKGYAKQQVIIYSCLTIKYHFAHEDGSEICVVVVGEGMDYGGDKASNKAMAIALKYACLQVFCIPTDDIPDPDATTPPPSTPQNGSAKPHNGSQKTSANNTDQETSESLNKEIGSILKTLDPDERPLFSEKEMDMERAVFNGAADLNVIKNQRDRLIKELEKRRLEFKPIPFGDEKPTMYTEPEPEFVDDKPWETPAEKPKKEIGIFKEERLCQ